MSSNDFNYINQYRYPQEGTPQHSSATHRCSQPDTTGYYQQTSAAVESGVFPQDYQRQRYAQTRSDFDSHWYNGVVGTTASNQAISAGTVGNAEIPVSQETTGVTTTEAGRYDTSALGSLAYASGLQYSTGEGSTTPQASVKAFPTARTYGAVNQSGRSQPTQNRYQAPTSNAVTNTLPTAASSYQQNSSNTAHTGSHQPTSNYTHQTASVPINAPVTTTTAASYSSLNAVAAQTLPLPNVKSYQRNTSGNTASLGAQDTSVLPAKATTNYQSSQNQQPYQYPYNHSQNRAQSQPLAQGHAQTQAQSHASDLTPAYTKSRGQSTQTRQTPAQQQGRPSPAITASQQQRQAMYQNYQDYNTPQTRTSTQHSLSSAAHISQTITRSQHVRQASAESHLLRQQDQEPIRASTSQGDTRISSPFSALHQTQQSQVVVQERSTNHQNSSSEHRRAVTPSFYTQQQQNQRSQLVSPSNISSVVQLEQRLPSPQTSIPATVNPSHVYNPYHEYRREIEAAEAEQAKQASQATLHADAAASAQLLQEAQRPDLDMRLSGQRSTASVPEAIGNVTPNPSEQHSSNNHQLPSDAPSDVLRTSSTGNENDAEALKKKLMMEKMLELMREDSTLFSHAVEELKNASPQITTQPGKEPTFTCQDGAPSQLAAKPKKPRAPRRKKNAANITAVHQARHEPSATTTAISSDASAQGTVPQPLKQVQKQSPVPPFSQAVPLSAALPVPQTSATRLQQPRAVINSQPSISTQLVQTYSSHSRGPPSATLQSQPPKGASVWPESKKEALGVNAVRFLTSVPENAGKSITTGQICAILDGSPSYVELCEEIENVGFKLDRVKFAKALLAVVPEANNIAAIQAQQPPKNNGNPIPPGGKMPLTANNSGSAQYMRPTDARTSASSVTVHNDVGTQSRAGSVLVPTIVNSTSQEARVATPVSADAPAKRSRGRPRKYGTPSQPWTEPSQKTAAMSPQQMPNGPHSLAGSAPAGESARVQSSTGNEQQQQELSAVQSNSNPRTGDVVASSISTSSRPLTEPNTNRLEHGHFTPLNNSTTPQQQSNITNQRTSSHSIELQVASHSQLLGSDSQSLGDSMNADCGNGMDDSHAATSVANRAGPLHVPAAFASFGFASHKLNKGRNASPLQYVKPIFPSVSSTSNLLFATVNPVTLNKSTSEPYKNSYADLDSTSTDPDDLDEPPLPDHLSYLDDQFKRVASESQATTPATNANRASTPTSMGLPSRPASTGAPQLSSKATTQARSTRKSQLLDTSTLAKPLHREVALKKSSYNSKTIARDILLTLGRHPEGALNLHLERIKLKTTRGQSLIDLSTLDWGTLDPVVLAPTMEGSENAVGMTLDDPSLEAPPKIMRRTRERLAAASDPANHITVPINSQLNTKRKRSSAFDNRTQRRSGRMKATPQPLSGQTNTPAQPSRLRNELKPIKQGGQTPIVVVKSYLLNDEDHVKAGKKLLKNAVAVDPGPSGYLVFECDWNKCQAKLHNFSNLERHTDRVHLDGLEKPFTCYWKDCVSSDKACITFSGKSALREHIYSAHLKPMEEIMGRGPRASDNEDIMPDMSNVYLSDSEGRRVIQETSLLAPGKPGSAVGNRGGRTKLRKIRVVMELVEVEKLNTPSGLFDRGKKRKQTLRDSSLFMACDGEKGHAIVFPAPGEWVARFEWNDGFKITTIATEPGNDLNSPTAMADDDSEAVNETEDKENDDMEVDAAEE